ncbi:xanthine dehydrogenase family protein subunit M [Bradyrhizobium sp. RD5-C2]|uniref:FAD binding domain-containing protein n=1 Tax=Bradyrhizobium sp. RD5-C2 TaxID=244562 RepID=UPI001CC628B5|nr:FAD binding domain-containing protein [Bradyrhizobium sp. RD5-C2]GIQ78996.1 oxidoreductase [Bradyrhizobium sp. RD5-C2]
MSVAIAEALSAPEFRAAGTDLSERRRSGLSCGSIIDLTASPDTIGIAWSADGAARIGALTAIAAIASDARLAQAYPGIAAAAQGLATPQIRHMATLGGNLAQRSRCWYFRNPQIACLKKGGSDCPARSGNHLYHVAFDLGPCVAPHPSTMAMALLAYDAKIVTDRRSGLSITDLLGDGSNGAADNLLAPGERIERIELPAPLAGERALYKRAISRTHAEWPLVEVCVRAVIEGGVFREVHLTAGGIAPVPLRLAASAAALRGKPADASTIAHAAELATSGARPLTMTGYKLDLLTGLVRDLVERIAA